MVVITAEIESGFVAKDDLVPFRCNPVSSCATPHQTEASMMSVKGSSRNGCRDLKGASARCLRMIREHTGALSQGATCAWIMAVEVVGCTRAFLTMWRSSRQLVCRGRPEPGLHVHDISRIQWSQHNQSGQIDELLA
ncbi:uncharacterized protein TNCV_2902841 [Trichonephila clavipes]|nr:uncharacterized protein TNCV_2902841 [Trichonephila clavipes]